MKFRDDRIEFTRELKRFGDDFWLLSRFARTFIAETPLRIETIRRAVGARNAEGVRQAANGLAEVLRTLGAFETAAIADEVARCVHDQDLERAKLLVIALRRNLHDLIDMVKTWPPIAAAHAEVETRALQTA